VQPQGGQPVDGYLDGPGEPGLVSVIIPTHNRATIIGAAIESVLAQSYRDVEIVIVDDGSTDDTRAVVERYGWPVRYVHQPNGGVSSARNFGFLHARGEFVALLDSDDAFLPWKIEAQVEMLRAHPEVGMVWTDMSAVDPDGRVVEERYLRTMYDAHALAHIERVLERAPSVGQRSSNAPSDLAAAPTYKGDLFSSMLLGNLVHTSTVLLRRDRLRRVGGFDTSLLHSGEDYEFHLRTCSHGPVAFIDAPSLRYRVGAADQLTAPRYGIYTARNNLTTVLRWLELGRGRIELPEQQVRRRLAQSFRWVGEAELALGDRGEARAYLWKSLRYVRDRRTALLLLFAGLPVAALRSARALKGRYLAIARAFMLCLLGMVIGFATPRAVSAAGAPLSSCGRGMPIRRMSGRQRQSRRRVGQQQASSRATRGTWHTRMLPFPATPTAREAASAPARWLGAGRDAARSALRMHTRSQKPARFLPRLRRSRAAR
jgi:glycosyltransferase involved in cell wall biosynthesis